MASSLRQAHDRPFTHETNAKIVLFGLQASRSLGLRVEAAGLRVLKGMGDKAKAWCLLVHSVAVIATSRGAGRRRLSVAQCAEKCMNGSTSQYLECY